MSTGLISGLRISRDQLQSSRKQASSGEGFKPVLEALLAGGGVREALVIQTDSHWELYVVSPSEQVGQAVMREVFPTAPAAAVLCMHHEECLRHLLRGVAPLEGGGSEDPVEFRRLRDPARTVEVLAAPGPTLKPVLERAGELHVGQSDQAAQTRDETVEDAVTDLLEKHATQRVETVLSGIQRSADRIKREQVSTALSKLEHSGELTEEQRQAVETLADSLVSDLLTAPQRTLRTAAERNDWETVNAVINLFDPSGGDGPVDGTDTAIPNPGASAGEPALRADIREDD